MDMKTSEKILKAATEIEEALNSYPVPAPNSTIPGRIKFLASQLSAIDHYAAEKAYKIADLATIYYSARKHEKYRGGANAVWTDMTFDLLGRIRRQAKSREVTGD